MNLIYLFGLYNVVMNMNIKFDCIPVDVPSKKTLRIFTRPVLESICLQLNTAPSEVLITNHVGDTTSIDLTRVCGAVVRGSAKIIDNVLNMDANFFVKDFFLAQPYDFDPKTMDSEDFTKGNIMEKLTRLGGIEYSPVGTGIVDVKYVNGERVYYVEEYSLLYVLGQPIIGKP